MSDSDDSAPHHGVHLVENLSGREGLSGDDKDLSASDSWAVEHADCYKTTPGRGLQTACGGEQQQQPGTQGGLDGGSAILEHVPSLSLSSSGVGEGVVGSCVSFHSQEDRNIGHGMKEQQQKGAATRSRKFDVKNAIANLQSEHLRALTQEIKVKIF